METLLNFIGNHPWYGLVLVVIGSLVNGFSSAMFTDYFQTRRKTINPHMQYNYD